MIEAGELDYDVVVASDVLIDKKRPIDKTNISLETTQRSKQDSMTN